MKKKILFVLINYNNSKEVISYVEKIMKLYGASLMVDICIVNNTNKNEYYKLRNEFSSSVNIDIFHSLENLGYLNGAYYAFEKKYNDNYMYTIICNTDIDFENLNFLNLLVENEYSNKVMIVAPKIIRTVDEFNQNPFFNFKPSRLKFITWKIAYSNNIFFVLYNWLSLLKIIIRKRKKPQNKTFPNSKVYAAHGSFLIISTAFFNSLGTLKYPSFLFGEELFLANQVEKMGGEVVYNEQLVVMHNEHSTTSKLKIVSKRKMMKESIDYLYKVIY